MKRAEIVRVVLCKVLSGTLLLGCAEHQSAAPNLALDALSLGGARPNRGGTRDAQVVSDLQIELGLDPAPDSRITVNTDAAVDRSVLTPDATPISDIALEVDAERLEDAALAAEPQ